MDSIDYYERYAVPYYEATIDQDMTEIMAPFIEQLEEGAEVLDLGCGSGRDTLTLMEQGFIVTGMDGSAKMCELAGIYTDQEILQLKFEEMEFDDVFDGIWACASLVHVTPQEMPDIMKRIICALKEDGVLYFSVSEGERDGIYSGRYFHDYTKQEIKELIRNFPQLELIDLWRTDDVGNDQQDKKWLNVLVKKVKE